VTPRGAAAVGGAVALLYAPVAAGLARQWYEDPASSHGILLVAAAAIVLRRRWRTLAATPLAPSNAGFVALACSLILYAAASLAGELFMLRMSAVASLAAVVLTLAGVQPLRLLAAPFALVVLAIPLPAVVVTSLTLRLQLVASQMAAAILNGMGIEAVRDGNLLTLSSVTLEVAEACSGLRSIVSLIALIAVCKAVGRVRARDAILLMFATLPVAIVGNALRVTATGVLAHVVGAWTARGWVHDLAGYVAFIGMCLVLGGLYRIVLMRRSAAAREQACESHALAW